MLLYFSRNKVVIFIELGSAYIFDEHEVIFLLKDSQIFEPSTVQTNIE